MAKIGSYLKVQQAMSPISAASGGLAEKAYLDCTGFDRHAVVVNVGTFEYSTASVNASIWESATSGGTYTVISGSLTTISSTGRGEATYIDVPVSSSKVYQKLIASGANGYTTVGAISILYDGSSKYPKTQENTATVV